MSEERKTVRVRVAVVVDGGGQWGAHGWGLAVVGRESGYDKHAMKAAEDELDPPLDDLRSVVFLEADIPLPSAPTVEGEVAGEAARREAPVFYQVCSVQGDTVHARRELESSTLCGVTNFNGTPDYFDPDNPPAFACLRCRKALRRDIEGAAQ